MILKKITEKDILGFLNKNVICFEKSDSYLQELQEQFSITDKISYIIDDFKRSQGQMEFDGNKIKIVGSEYLETADLKDTVIIITSDYFYEAYEKLCNIKSVREQFNIIYFFANKETEIELGYREKYADDDLQDIIVFRSGPHESSYICGMDFSDNARAIFEYMLSENYNQKYELIWFVKNPEEFSRFHIYINVKFISWDWKTSKFMEQREEYYRALCLAKYFFFTDAYGFARNCRKDQIRVQLWHGCGFKTRVNFVRCERRYEYTTVISDLYAQIHADIYGLREDQVLITGYAKQDWLKHPVSSNVFAGLGMPLKKKYIFWLPTFRLVQESLFPLNEPQEMSETGLPIIYSKMVMQEIDELLGRNNIALIVKLHPFQDRSKVFCADYENIVLLENEQLLEADIQINQLLGWADALISDYSSVAVDYLLLNRPMAFTLDDVEEYKASRGFVFENIEEWLPGVEVYNQEDFVRFIQMIANGIDSSCEKRNKIRDKMYRYTDDRNCYRILERLKIEGCNQSYDCIYKGVHQ